VSPITVGSLRKSRLRILVLSLGSWAVVPIPEGLGSIAKRICREVAVPREIFCLVTIFREIPSIRFRLLPRQGFIDFRVMGAARMYSFGFHGEGKVDDTVLAECDFSYALKREYRMKMVVLSVSKSGSKRNIGSRLTDILSIWLGLGRSSFFLTRAGNYSHNEIFLTTAHSLVY
jgi:hypothetical protein